MLALASELCHTYLMTFQTLRLLEHDPIPQARWLIPEIVPTEVAILEYREDAEAVALDSIEELG